jgi:hypothetical protein
VRDQALGFLEACGMAFKGYHDHATFHQVYIDLKHTGVVFPARDVDNNAPMVSPKHTTAPGHHPSPIFAACLTLSLCCSQRVPLKEE